VLGPALHGFIQPDGVRTTLDFLTPAGRQAALAAASRLKAGGAECIALACTGLSTIGLAGEIAARLAITVVDPVEAGAAVLNYLGQNRG
jgi:Asp/Glu/hydantoin racemase